MWQFYTIHAGSIDSSHNAVMHSIQSMVCRLMSCQGLTVRPDVQ